MLKSYQYKSCIASFIEGLIRQKRLSGYSYELEAYILRDFDTYCIEKGLREAVLRKEFLQEWFILRPTESQGYRSQRISFVRQLALYMNSQGSEAYIPKDFSKKDIHVPHIMSDKEISSLFEVIDHYQPVSQTISFQRLDVEYKILFRLIYCCGLRNSEACNLKSKDVDFENKMITIIHSKGDKDRLVYLPEDLASLCQQYWNYLKSELSMEPIWFFPGRCEKSPLPKTSLDRKFNEFWSKTPYADACDKKPTVHSLRHSFVVKRMNLWMEEGIDLNVMMPYLSKYLGHRGRDETFYYYHQVDSAFKIIRQKDKVSDSVIPEVIAYEE